MTFNNLERHTVQEFEPKDSLGYASVWLTTQLGTSANLPSWGEHARERALRDLYRNEYNWIAQASVAALVRKVKATPWEIKAGRNTATYFTGILQDAHFLEGWGQFLSRLLLDLLTCDYGAYIEVIGPGNPDTPLAGRVTGVAALDSLRCVPTGNPEFPVVYYARRTNTMHRLHHTRVIRLVDMPDGDESRHFAGLSSLSRAASLIEQQIPLMQYVAEMMGQNPPAGAWYNNSGLGDEQWEQAKRSYDMARKNGQAGIIEINNGNLGQEVGGEFLPFRIAPDGFDYQTYVEIAVNAFAAAFGIDRQDIYPLTGGMAGTATQSQVLAEKANGMAFGDILTMIERAINNHVLPDSAEFSFTYKDEEKDLTIAQRDYQLTQTSQLMIAQGVPLDNVMRYLANMSDTFRAVLTDDGGEIIRLPDDDPKAPAQTETVVMDDVADATPDDAVTLDENKAYKAIQATRLDFEMAFMDLLPEMRNGTISRRRAGIILRGMLRTYGAIRAYDDGLQDGGVDPSERDKTDDARAQSILAEQSQYVSNLTDQIYNKGGITDAQARGKAILWFNKSVSPFYDAGRMSADKNGMYEWSLGRTEQHCKTCSRLNGQIHRLKTYIQKQLFPRSSKLECNGFRCDCRLNRTQERARGRL